MARGYCFVRMKCFHPMPSSFQRLFSSWCWNGENGWTKTERSCEMSKNGWDSGLQYASWKCLLSSVSVLYFFLFRTFISVGVVRFLICICVGRIEQDWPRDKALSWCRGRVCNIMFPPKVYLSLILRQAVVTWNSLTPFTRMKLESL